MRSALFFLFFSWCQIESGQALAVGLANQENFSVKDTSKLVKVHYTYAEGISVAEMNNGSLPVQRSFTLVNNTKKPQEFNFYHSRMLNLSTKAGVLKPNGSLKIQYSFSLTQPSQDERFAAIYVKGSVGKTMPVLELHTSWKLPFNMERRRIRLSESATQKELTRTILLDVRFEELNQRHIELSSKADWLHPQIINQKGEAALSVTSSADNGFGLGVVELRHKPTGHQQHLLVDWRRKPKIVAIPPVVIRDPVSKSNSTISIILSDYPEKSLAGKITTDDGELKLIKENKIGKDLVVELKLTKSKATSKTIKLGVRNYPSLEIPILRGHQPDKSQPVFEFENIDAKALLIDSIIKAQSPLWPRRTVTQQVFDYGPAIDLPTKKGTVTAMTYQWDQLEHPNGDYLELTKKSGKLVGNEKYSSQLARIRLGDRFALYPESKKGNLNSSPAPLRNAYFRPLDLPFFAHSFDELILGRLQDITINWTKPTLRVDKSRTVLLFKGEVHNNGKPPTFRYELEFDPENYLALISAKTYRIKNNQLVNRCDVEQWLTQPGLFGIPGRATRFSYQEDGSVITMRRTELLNAKLINLSEFQTELRRLDKDSLLQNAKQKIE